LPFLYSTPFNNEINLKLEDILEQYPKKIVVLDTNICVYLREFYNNPSEFIKKYSSIIEDLINLLGKIERYDLDVSFGIGLDESCRNLDSFELQQEKQTQMRESILNLLNLDSFALIQLIYSNQVIESIKDITKKGKSKIEALKHQDSYFTGLNIPTYACMLKIYLLNLDLKSNKINRLQAFEEVIKFMDQKLDLVGASIATFAFHYFGGNKLIKNILNKSAKNENEVIHNIWNASLDVCIPLIVSNHYSEEDGIPILVTADKGLNKLIELISLNNILTVDGRIARVPQLTSFTEEGTTWTEDELEKLEYLSFQLFMKRMNKITNPDNSEETINSEKLKIKKIVENLEMSILSQE